MTLAEVLNRLDNVKGGSSPNQFTARCPAHDDGHNSLSIGINGKGDIALYCHAGCQIEDILEALDMTKADLFQKPSPEQDFGTKTGKTSRLVATYDYMDADGNLIAQKLRYEPKGFSWRRPNGRGGWEYNRKGVEVPLYNVHAVSLSDHVFIVEGEKDVDTLIRLGKAAVCSPDGAGQGKQKWKQQYSEMLRGKHVAVIQDNDKPGQAFAQSVCTALLGTAASVRLLDLREVWPEIPEKGDVSDFVAKWGDDQSAAQVLTTLANNAPEYVPGEEANTNEDKKIDYSKIRCKSMADIDFSKTPPIKFYIDGILAQGLTFMNAFAKVGKSRMEMQMLLALCRGERLLGRDTLKCGVLFMALEDEQADFETRSKKFLNGDPQPANFHYVTKDMFDFKPPTLDNDNLLVFIREQLKAFPDIKVVAIDVFGVIRSRKEQEDFTMHERRDLDKLLKFAAENEIALLIAHHVSKAGMHQSRSSSIGSGAGSYVISGTVHAEIEIALDPDDQKRAKLSVKGRRMPALQLAIRDEYPFWKLEGDWDAIVIAEDPVVVTAKYLVERYGVWKGSAKQFKEENEQNSDLPQIQQSLNKNSFKKYARQLQSAGIRYTQHPNGSGGTLHEFCSVKGINDFVELSSNDFEEIPFEME